MMRAAYDLAKSPPTHDFVNWLARAEAARIAAGEDALEVAIVPGVRRISPRDFAYTQERRAWRIQHLLAPLAWLMPSVASVVVVEEGEQQLSYGNPGRPLAPIFRAPAHALEQVRAWLPANAVTITLRESDFEPVRNTSRNDWLRVAVWLKANGYEPVIIPDAEAEMRGEDFPAGHGRVYHAAAHCVGLRLALYELASMNLMTNSGVMVMALHADVPLMCFRLEVPEVPCCHREHLVRSGFSPAHDWSTNRHAKRLFWERDTFDNVTRALRLYMPANAEAA